MAQVIGALREDEATYGEKLVLKLLKENLPKEYFVYVECPVHGKRVERYPDFIILTNYGVIVLEVKDWVHILEADRFRVTLRTRQNETRQDGNPVTQVREIAILLNQELHEVARRVHQDTPGDIPWGYAVVLPNIGLAQLSQLRKVWGEERVLSKNDLQPGLITSRLKITLPENKVRTLSKSELDLVRGAINPVATFESPDRPLIILNDEQEKIVAETIVPEKVVEEVEPSVDLQARLFETEIEAAPGEVPALEIESTISQNTSIRLVRGVAGSGKTLVLTQRARYLAAQYPEWSIAVLTFNDQLRAQFDASLRGLPNVHPMTFHSLCSNLLRGYRPWKEPTNASGWIVKHRQAWPGLQEFSANFLGDEIRWIKETGVTDREVYLNAERKGRGQSGRLMRNEREMIFDMLEAYNEYLATSGIPDWADLPQLVLDGIAEKAILPPAYDAILVDEAQDFAPMWFKVIEACLNPAHGLLFLTDDPAQSIYRYYSWKEKGINVVGRTRWLRVPYRNTYEIYQAAYRLIADDPILTRTLLEENSLVTPDLMSASLRHGPRPLLQVYRNMEDEIAAIHSRVAGLQGKGLRGPQIAVLGRKKSTVTHLETALRGTDVTIGTFHNLKGLEFEAVFLVQLQEAKVDGDENQLSEERRLVYMAMTRARSELYLGYSYKLPDLFLPVLEAVDRC